MFQKVASPRFQANRGTKLLRLSVPGTDRRYPQEIFLVLFYVRDWFDPRTMVRPERLCNQKFQ